MTDDRWREIQARGLTANDRGRVVQLPSGLRGIVQGVSWIGNQEVVVRMNVEIALGNSEIVSVFDK